ncbi:MAG: hypothetical protein LIP00_12010 [Parabacteroides sp.]|nr:hypothetical protein [Parabacteroides sp.]
MYLRFAAHFIYYNGLFRMHCLELDAEGCVRSVFPLHEEIAGTSFYNGIIVAAPVTVTLPDLLRYIREEWPAGLPVSGLTGWLGTAQAAAFLQVPPGEPVALFQAPRFTGDSLLCLYPEKHPLSL